MEKSTVFLQSLLRVHHPLPPQTTGLDIPLLSHTLSSFCVAGRACLYQFLKTTKTTAKKLQTSYNVLPNELNDISFVWLTVPRPSAVNGFGFQF
jgi:hypothetical protein